MTTIIAGTGNVLKIQQLLHTCSEYHAVKEDEGVAEEGDAASPKESTSASSVEAGAKEGAAVGDKSKKTEAAKKSGDVEMKDAEVPDPGSLSEPGAHQAVSVLGIALIAMGEEIGAEMALRTFNHLVRGHIFKTALCRMVVFFYSILASLW